MRRPLFETLSPVCPVCRLGAGDSAPLELGEVLAEDGEHVIEGVLRCTRQRCQSEFPITAGIPLILPSLRALVSTQLQQILSRDDLPETLESLIGDCCGPGSPFDSTRRQLSSYGWDHYADLDPAEPAGGPRPGAAVRLLERGLELAGLDRGTPGALPSQLPPGPVIDLGCAVGRTTFELAERTGRPALGVDLNFAMLRIAAGVLRRGVACYPRRRLGLVYDRRQLAAAMPAAGRVDFWACDAAALPFAGGTFAAAAALNVLDSAHSPAELLQSIAATVAAGGRVCLSCPYDWSPAATPVEAWLGGHSQRGPDRGAAEPVLRRLLTPGAHPASIEGLEVLAEEEAVPWRVRMHERSIVEYAAHLVVAKRVDAGPDP